MDFNSVFLRALAGRSPRALRFEVLCLSTSIKILKRRSPRAAAEYTEVSNSLKAILQLRHCAEQFRGRESNAVNVVISYLAKN